MSHWNTCFSNVRRCWIYIHTSMTPVLSCFIYNTLIIYKSHSMLTWKNAMVGHYLLRLPWLKNRYIYWLPIRTINQILLQRNYVKLIQSSSYSELALIAQLGFIKNSRFKYTPHVKQMWVDPQMSFLQSIWMFTFKSMFNPLCFWEYHNKMLLDLWLKNSLG